MGSRQKTRKQLKIEQQEQKRMEIKQRAKGIFWRKVHRVTKYVVVLLIVGFVFFGGKWAVAYFSDKSKKSKSAKTNTSTKPEVNISGATATIATNKGNITLEFYPKDAPKTVENFLLLAKRGKYNRLKFHRYEPGFVIQGGDPLSKDSDPKNDGQGGESAWGGKFKDELNPAAPSFKRGYMKGVLAMANSGKDTNGSQFFIMLKDNKTLPKQYTIFGNVTGGMDVVMKLRKGDVMKTITIKEK